MSLFQQDIAVVDYNSLFESSKVSTHNGLKKITCPISDLIYFLVNVSGISGHE
jgi:hypothetical protein